jgi:hypothetical protein
MVTALSSTTSPLPRTLVQEETSPPTSELTWMQNTIKTLRDHDSPLLLKIAVIASSLIFIVGTGFLLGNAVLFTLAITVPVVIWTGIEWDNLVTKEKEKAALQKAELVKERTLAFQAMQEAVGGSTAFHRLPILEIGNRTGATGYLDFLKIQDLPHPVMRGTDHAGRPFISVRLRSNRNQDRGQQFVVTFFQRYSDSGGRWTWGTTFPEMDLFGNVLRDTDRAAIREIVVTRNNPQFTLV